MTKILKRPLSILLAVLMIAGVFAALPLTAYADDTPPYAQYKNTTTVITFDSKSWYLIDYDANTVTLLAKECVGESQYSGNNFVQYSQSTVKTVVDNWYNNNITADAKTAVSGGGMFLLTTAQANAITNAEVRKDATVASNFSSGWWLCSMGNADNKAALVFGGSGEVYADGLSVLLTRGVRPALKLDLSKVVFKSDKNTFSLPTSYTALDDNTKPVINVKRGETTVTSGAPQIGDVLTAETDATDLVYEWYRGNEKISSATEDTYTLTTADLSKAISVKVYQTKDADGNDVTEVNRPTQTSTATAAVEKKTSAATQIAATDITVTKTDTGVSFTAPAQVNTGSEDVPVYKYEYGYKTGDATDYTWTDTLPISGLNPGTEYEVVVREKATADTVAGPISEPVTVKTDVTVTLGDTLTEGQAVNVTITPSTTGVTYKWYIDDGDTPDGTGEKIVPSKGGTKLKVEVYSGDPETLIGTTTTTTTIKTLAEVINDSNDDPVTITLDGPVTGGISIPAGKEVILDIKGQQVSGDIDVPATSTLTITDNSNPQTGTVKGTVKANTGTVIIESGKFDKTPVATNPGTVTIKGGLFKEDPTTILNVPYEVKESGNQDYPYEVYKAYEALTTENKPTISTTKATDNTDENPQIGDKLTATTAAKPVTYQWYRDGVAIENATTDSYVITADDLGKAITVSITQSTNENGSNLETPLTQTSDATTAIVKSDVQAVGDVETMIDDLPATTDVTIADKDAIEAAKEAYDALSDAQKAKVNTDKLNALNADLVALVISEASAKTGNDVIYTGNQIKLINTPTTALPAGYTLKYAVTTENTAPTDDNLYTTSIPEKTDVGTYYVWYKVIGNQNYTDTAVVTISEPDKTELEAAIAAAEEFYNSIKDTDDYKTIAAALKEAITTAKTADDSSTVTAGAIASAKEEIATAKKTAEDGKKDVDDKAAADAVTNMINTLPMADQVKTTDKESIVANRKAYDALTADQKAKVDATTLKKLTDAETALAAAEKKETDDANAVKKVNDSISKLPANDKVATTDKAAIEAARKAYDALSADQKAKVDATTLKKLTDAETALAAAEKKAAEEKAAKELAAAKEEAQAAMNEQVTVTQKGKKFTIKWKKSSSADGYYVYASYCGKKETKPVKTIKKNTTTKTTITKINGKKINQKKNFHVYVVPYKIIDGKKVTLGKSTVAHLVGSKNTKYSNVKKLTLTKKKYTVKVGKTAKIKAKVTLVNKNKKHIPKGHGAKFRYKSSDTSIATVSKKGKIKGIKKGTCTIYVYSINGLVKKAKVTVK